MNKRLFLVLLLVSLAFSGTIAVSRSRASAKTIIVPDDFATIKDAVGNATAGDTVVVRSGTYSGGILINKPLTLMGENSKNTIIAGGLTEDNLSLVTTDSLAVNLQTDMAKSLNMQQSASAKSQTTNFLSEVPPKIIPANFLGIPPPTYALYINSSDVLISGFTIKDAGIPLSGNGDRLRISQNVIGTSASCNFDGSYITITNNTGSGVYVQGSFNLIAGNTLHVSLIGDYNAVYENDGGGIFLVGSNNTIVGNAFNDFFMQNADSNIIINNTVSGANEGLTVGFYGEACSYNLFAGNKVQDSGLWGISMRAGSYNVFYGNLVTNTGNLGHDGYGLTLGGNTLVADKNLFIHNIFENNAENFGTNWPVNGDNSFDDGTEGNYWDDYLLKYPNATEFENSGTGNIPYIVVDSNMDNHPLLSQPSISEKVPTLPAPWASLLPVLSPLPSPSALPTASFPPKPSASKSPSPSPSPTPTSSSPPLQTASSSPSVSPSFPEQPASSPEPKSKTIPEEFIFAATGAALIAIIAIVALVFNKKRRSSRSPPDAKSIERQVNS